MPVRLLSVQVGHPAVLDSDEGSWVTSIFKSPVDGAIELGETNLAGDAQADLRVHGGPDKAVCVYSADHFAAWREELPDHACEPGAFGENFTVTGQTESTVCIDDVYAIGTAIVQVSQPRGPCWKLARRWKRLDFVRLVAKTGRTGWYLRVLRPGIVAAGQTFELLERSRPDLTIAQANRDQYGT